MTLMATSLQSLMMPISGSRVRDVPSLLQTRPNTALSDSPREIDELRYPVPGGAIVVRVGSDTPSWCQPIATRLSKLLRLEPNWDSYGARRVDPQHVEGILRLLNAILRQSAPAPAVVPTSRGGIQVEWHRNGVDLEIETVSPFRFLVSYENTTTHEEWEREITSDFSPLVEIVALVS